MPATEVIKKLRLRTGFFKIYESVDRLDLLELEIQNLKKTNELIREESFKNKVNI